MKNKYFKLFANCIPVKGYRRSTICDLQRKDYDFVPNSLVDILSHCESHSVAEIIELNKENEIIIEEYFEFLIKKEYGFYCEKEDLKEFPKLDPQFYNPSIITNAILDFDRNSSYNLNTVRNELDELGCKALQMRFLDTFPIEKIENIVDVFRDSRLRHIDLLMKFNSAEGFVEYLEAMSKRNPRILLIVVYGCPKDVVIEFESVFTKIYFTKDLFENENCCGVVSPNYFAVNFDLFLESLNFNSCLNKKIAVDKNGNLKNCPSMKDHYGQVGMSKMSEIVNNADFKKRWSIKKDQIETCRDCEFRHICTDCRAYLEDADHHAYAKPLKCNYDPYTATWKSDFIKL